MFYENTRTGWSNQSTVKVSRAAVTKAAVDFAKEKNRTLVGFIRKNSGNIYNEGKVQLHE